MRVPYVTPWIVLSSCTLALASGCGPQASLPGEEGHDAVEAEIRRGGNQSPPSTGVVAFDGLVAGNTCLRPCTVSIRASGYAPGSIVYVGVSWKIVASVLTADASGSITYTDPTVLDWVGNYTLTTSNLNGVNAATVKFMVADFPIGTCSAPVGGASLALTMPDPCPAGNWRRGEYCRPSIHGAGFGPGLPIAVLFTEGGNTYLVSPAGGTEIFADASGQFDYAGPRGLGDTGSYSFAAFSSDGRCATVSFTVK